MKNLLSLNTKLCSSLSLFLFLLLLLFSSGCKKIIEHLPDPAITTVATGLTNVIGVETDTKGNAWVALFGTGNNDGKIVVVTPDGNKYDAIVNLSSIINPVSGEIDGTANMLIDGDTMFITSAKFLYKANISQFTPGDAPLDGASIPYEDVGAFSLSYPWVNNAHDSHIYGITKGPDGDIYLTDAGANAVIHRLSSGSYTVLAEVPGYSNPTPVGPPQVQSVPTSILYDGNDFLVTTLTGFPFLPGYATVYKISLSGALSVYQGGFTTLVNIARGNQLGHLVVQYGTFGATGFENNTGALIWANSRTAAPLIEGLNMPVGIKQVSPNTWYVTTQGDGNLLKIIYKPSSPHTNVSY
ncbi:ScyD/ScyE family protein [Ilyomonas limi]|uniref:ScyD/ScyE family protein n=1 Tax=Ilyomonas limi TaxID=2575867 RepID=A0A4U3KQN0_9BACT|nr:ScyD/ScyE family protein [Ilyomonas limi]TKK64471.1 ScyD/ScyE family protein [Ilyomonas limi]